MNTGISKQLNQNYRTALLSYYIGQYAPNSENQVVNNYIKKPEDVYKYLLIDPLVAEEVTTSCVAQAISSVQQYINSIALNMEPGYTTSALDKDELEQWKGGASQYAIWAGEVELDTYPEDYLDPTLRGNKTDFFKNLETSLNQNKINSDTAQEAVLNYLNAFEKVANLEIVSGYMTGPDQLTSLYYFVGRTRKNPYAYYWRTLDMSQCPHNVQSCSAWSEWKPIDIPNRNDAMVGTLRPVVFNNRLYVGWFERTVTTESVNADNSKTSRTTLSVYLSYCTFDGSWSAPQLLNSIDSGDESNAILFDEDSIDSLSTMVVYDYPSDGTAPGLYLALFTKDDAGQWVSFDTQVDDWMNAARTDLSLSVFFDFFYVGNGGDKRIQYVTGGNSLYYVGDVTCNPNDDPLSAFLFLPDLTKSQIKLSQASGTEQYINISFEIVYPSNSYMAAPITLNDGSYKGFLGYYFLSCGMRAQFSLGDLGLSTYEPLTAQPYFYGSEGQQDSIYVYSFPEDNLIKFDGAAFANPNDLDKAKLSITNESGKSYLEIEYDELPVPSTSYTVWISLPENGPDAPLQSVPGYTSFEEGVSVDFPYIEIIDQKTTYSYLYGFTQKWGEIELAKTFGQVDIILQTGPGVSPLIATYADAQLGTAEYLSFVYADYTPCSFPDGTTVEPIRLNTLFAKELINKASTSITNLLTWNTQLTNEPTLTGGSPVPMDFDGANGPYFWELFFHMPYLVAHRLNQEQQYEDAQTWYHYIFDPAARGRISANPTYPEPDYWSVRPLVEQPAAASQGSLVQNPVDPDAIAAADPTHYRKAIFMAYVSNLIAAADANYRLLTNDGLADAKLRYCQAKDLLGPRPDVTLVERWQPDTLANVVANESEALRSFESNLVVDTPVFAGTSYAALSAIDSDIFIEPLNTQLLGYWNLLDSRLYNLRHNLSIDGQPINIPLYATPVNPTLLMEQSAQAGSLARTAATLSATIPPYRFRAMLQSAYGAVNTLGQFGQTLLSYYERGDNASLQELQQQQALDISSFTVSLQQQAIDGLNADAVALQSTKTMSQQRRDHYQALYDEGISGSESDAMNDLTTAGSFRLFAEPYTTTGAALAAIPNIFGLADGGAVYGAPLTAAGMIYNMAAEALQTTAQRIQTSEEYRRRSDEWQLQYEQAQLEMDSIDAQLDALSIRQQATQISLQQAQTEQANLQTTLRFLKNRFTQTNLYTWLSGQLSALYYQAYDSVLSLCLSAQACWQYEMGDITTTFIQTSAWNNSYHGLLVGETLQLNLHQMESAWLSRNQRRLEVTKTVSLKTLLGSDDFNTSIASGSLDFTLGESQYDSDYPGHYLRQITYISVSLPTLIGPYQDVRVTLTQAGSNTVLKPDIEAVNHLNDASTGSAANIVTNLRANQQIAISSGLNDSGLFMLNFGDERYLPFEGTGAVSSWRLSFPNFAKSQDQQNIVSNLNDVIVQVHYTALYGGSTFEQAVIGTLK